MHFYIVGERKVKKTIPFSITSKTIKYLRINLTKEVKDLYTENYKLLMKEIKENTNKWKDTQCSRIRRINVVKTSILSKEIYRSNVIPTKIPVAFFMELKQRP